MWFGSGVAMSVCGYGVCQQLQLRFNPYLAWELPYAADAALKRQKKKIIYVKL